jgi:hypothetical protein
MASPAVLIKQRSKCSSGKPLATRSTECSPISMTACTLSLHIALSSTAARNSSSHVAPKTSSPSVHCCVQHSLRGARNTWGPLKLVCNRQVRIVK